MVAAVRAGAHPVVEDAFRRRLGQVEEALVEEPLLIGRADRLELDPQGLDHNKNRLRIAPAV